MTPETRIKRLICSYLKLKYEDIYFWVTDRVGIYDAKAGVFRRNVDPYRIKGISDILGILPNGRLLAIEVKTKTGKVSSDQKLFIDKVNKLGGLAFVARSIDDVIHNLGEKMDSKKWDGITLEEALIALLKSNKNVDEISKFIVLLPEELKIKYRDIWKDIRNAK
jgi:hypothetical protein